MRAFVFLHRFSHGLCFRNYDFAAGWIEGLPAACLRFILVRVKLQTLHINEFLDDGDLVEQLRILVLPVPLEFYLRSGRRFKRDDLREILVLDRLVYG